MTSCPQDLINQIWRIFAAQGIGDDLQIVEALASHLLRLSEHEEQTAHSHYPQPIALSDTRTKSLESLLGEALGNLSPAELLNHCLLFRSDTMQAGGRYPTPRHITRLMADLARIFVADDQAVIGDFACGSGGLLVEFPGQEVVGIEISPTWARIARANLLLHGISPDEVYTNNALAVLGTNVTNLFDIIVMNPPFGSPLEAEMVEQHLGEGKGTRSETVLALLGLNYLKPDGILAILQPGGTLFSTSSGEATLRNRLLTENRLEAIIQLPKDAFQPYSQLQTYLLLARNCTASSIAADAPVWFYYITNDGFSSGRNRQPQPDQNQLPQLLAAVAAGQAEHSWEVRDDAGTVQLDIRPLTTSGYRIVQPSNGKLTVHTLTTPDTTTLWLTRQTDNTYHGLLHDAVIWEQRPIPIAGSDVSLEPLTFYLTDDNSQSVPVSLKQSKDGWQLNLKSPQTITPTDTIMPESGLLVLFVSTIGKILSPLLLLENVHKDYVPKPLTVLPLEDSDHISAGSLLLWDSSSMKPLFFASAVESKGWFLLAGTEEAVLISWENGSIQSAITSQLKRSFAGESWHRGVVIDGNGVRYGVGIASTTIRDEREFDLTFDRYYPPDESEPATVRSAAEILATMREKQQVLGSRLNYLLGIIEMRPAQALPAPVVNATPLYPLNRNQQLVWQRIAAMTETANEVTTARPFLSSDLAAGLNKAEVQSTLELFERMGIVVPVVIEGTSYYRRLTERDVVVTT